MEIDKNVGLVSKYCRLRRWSFNTEKVYCCAVKKFLYHFEKEKEPKCVNDSMIENYLLQFSGHSARCTNHSAIKLFYKLLGHPDKLKYTPYPAKPDILPNPISKQEFILMMRACDNIKHKCFMMIQFDCGLRVSELIALRLMDVDRIKMQLRIIQSKGRKDRVLKLSKPLLGYIDNYISKFNPDTYLFNGQNSLQYSIRSIQEVWKQCAARAGLNRNVKSHQARHGAAMAWLENGTDIAKIGKALGHKEGGAATEIYARINDKIIQSIESPIEQILRENLLALPA